jgi:predicted NUDIX family NTP pyrophosphohydrolase
MGSPASRAARGARHSAGILLYRERAGTVEVLLVHPGGPLWARRDEGVWSIPKGEHGAEEDPVAAARREFAEELGSPAPQGERELDLGEVRQRSGKRVRAFALRGELDAGAARSNMCEIEWPPRSGATIEIPEVDRAEWFTLERARERINPAQAPLLERLREVLDGRAPDRGGSAAGGRDRARGVQPRDGGAAGGQPSS